MKASVIGGSPTNMVTATVAAVLLLLSSQTFGFVAPSSSSSLSRPAGLEKRNTHSRRHMFNVFGPFGDFLNNGNNRRRQQEQQQRKQYGIGDDNNNNDNDPNTAAGTFRLLDLSVRQMKPGGLRLFLMFYCMGMQNTPDPGSWKADQPSTEEYVVDMWFHDKSAVLSIELTETAVTVDRVGSSPSQQYLMQETVILQGILDELDQCAHDDSVAEPNRLLLLQDKDAIEKARDAIAFG